MEMLLITDTYLSSVPFTGEVIKTNNESQQWKKANKIKESGAVMRKSSLYIYVYSEVGLAVGYRASLESHCVDHQLTCFVLRLILNWHNNTLRFVLNVLLEVTMVSEASCHGGTTFDWLIGTIDFWINKPNTVCV